MILLLNPPVSPKAPFPNRVVSGLYSLKKFLESKNITCIVRNIEKIDDLMAVNSGISEPPQIIGITALTYQFKSACRVAERLRRLYPDTPIVAGGAAPSGIGADVVKKHPFDICVKGEGEKALLKIYERSVTGRSLRDVPGIIYSSGKNLIDNPGCDLLEENDIPLPGDELYRNGGIFFDHTVRENAALFMFSRGCTGRCSFCMAHRIFPGSVRFIHPDRAVKRIKEIIQTFHIRHFVFDDDNFLSNPDYAVEIAERLAPFDIRFRVNMNAGIPDKKTLLKLKDSGLYKITTGVETIFKDTAGILKKPIH
ncbi:MAG: B12-binding domain-containing radical SAM protein, partial [Candidatus Muiribacteriaceae bacterium]